MKRILIFFTLLRMSSLAQAMVDEPAGCWRAQRLPCAFRATKAGESFSYQPRGGESLQFDLVAAKKASLILQDNGLKLIEGEIWLRSSRDLKIETNQISAKAEGEFWIQIKENKTEMKNLQAEFTTLQMTGLPRGAQEISLPVGFENWYGGLNSAGELSVGVLRPIDRAPFFSSWARHMKISKIVAIEKMEKWKEIWQAATAASSELYAKVIERKIAEDEERNREIQRRKDEEVQERRHLLQMFRARHSLGEP